MGKLFAAKKRFPFLPKIYWIGGFWPVFGQSSEIARGPKFHSICFKEINTKTPRKDFCCNPQDSLYKPRNLLHLNFLRLSRPTRSKLNFSLNPKQACDLSSLASCPITVAILAQGTHWAVAITQAFFRIIFNYMIRTKMIRNDSCGVRTHALSEWRLKPPP